MAKSAKPFTTPRRNDSKTFQLTLNPSCGLPRRVCEEWHRRSFLYFPDDLAQYRTPKTKAAAEAGALALISYLKKKAEEGSARRISIEDITVGAWIEKFTAIETSPRTGINASKNKPNSLNTLDAYNSYYHCHIKNDPISNLRMSEVEEEDIMEYITRLSVSKLKDGRQTGGTRTFATVISFMRMTFNEYQRINRTKSNPFQYIDKPKSNKISWDALPEDEMIKLFSPDVHDNAMEFAVCAVMFLSGLRRGEIAALRPEDLDWNTPKITVCRAWQRFASKNKVLGPTKGKKVRFAPFDPLLQKAVKKLWEENGRHDFVFCDKKGGIIGSQWIENRFKKWLKRAGIELGGRRIVPHSSRHSLASLLEARGVSLRYIQELLGHSDLETTKIYLHSTEKTIRDIGNKISAVMENGHEDEKILDFKVS
jgi:integrase